MHICFVNDYFLKDPVATITGPMVQCYLLATGLARRGWEVDYVATTQSDRAEKTECHEGVNVHYVGVPRRLMVYRQSAAIARGLRSVHADVYYFRGRSPMAGMTARAAAERGAKFVWASSGDTGCRRGKYLKEQLAKKHGLRRLVYLPIFAWADRQYERAIETADLILAQNKKQMADLQNEFQREAILLKSGHPVPSSSVLQKTEPLLVLWISTLKPEKQPQLFLDLVEQCANANAQFVVVGKTTDPMWRRKLEDLSRRFSIFSYLGEVPFEKVSVIFAKAGLLINTSKSEGLPNAFVQAWLHGAPVLSLNVDPDEIMEREGIGIRAGNMETLVHQTRGLIANPMEREAMGRKAREVAEKEFDLEVILDKFEALIRKTVQTSGPSPENALVTPAELDEGGYSKSLIPDPAGMR